MPAYEYQCETCDLHFEKRQKMSDQPVEVWAACGGKVRRLISGGAGAISRGSHVEAASACGMGGPCGGGMCGRGMGCEQN